MMISNLQKRQPRRALRTRRAYKSLGGSVFCAGAALATSAFATGRPWQAWVPLLFTVVLLLVAMLSGVRAGILGTVLAAAIFAFFLFSPVGSIRVASGAARTNLGWMLLIGITFSLLFAPSSADLRQDEHHAQTTEPDSSAS